MRRKARELRELTEQELGEELNKYKQELFNLRFQSVSGQMTNVRRIREVKRTIARIKTVLQEKWLAKHSVSSQII